MKKTQIPNTLLTFAVITVLLLSTTPTAHAFTHLKQQKGTDDLLLLIDKVHEKHWNIVYTFSDKCPEEKTEGAKQLEEDIVTALQILLQPLREYDTKLPIVNDFRFQMVPAVEGQWIAIDDLMNATFALTDTCERDKSRIATDDKFIPHLVMEYTDFGEPHFLSTLIHEMAHAFGLGDTYIGRADGEDAVSTGGMEDIIGIQPASRMAMHLHYFGYGYISEDDINGIVWLYKVHHEGLSIEDCFFPNYKFEEKPAGCIPKWPLIFEIRQGFEVLAIRILNQDPNIDVNQQDALGNTALHYGVMSEHQKFIEALLEHSGVIMNRRNKAGKTPLSLAREIGNEEIITAIEEHKD